MKLTTFLHQGSVKSGALTDQGVVDLTAIGDVITLVADPETRWAADAAVAAAHHLIPLDEVRLLTPFHPRSIIGVGLNYLDHVRETGAKPPARPVIFAKFANAVAGPNDVITWHADATREVDYEAELGVVIGRPCYRVAKAEALQYVGGYTCVNDLSARDIQLTDSGKQWTLGKTLDGFCPIGPLLVTADEIPDPQNLDIRCVLNGVEVQRSNTREMLFDVATLVSHLSQFMTLMPGDLIATGTPYGVGMSRTPPLWLKDGDVCTVEIAGIGALTNTMRVIP